jgi:hypothetical protein
MKKSKSKMKKSKSKMKKGGAYINKNDIRKVFSRVNSDLLELKNNGFNLLEKKQTKNLNAESIIYFRAVISMIANAIRIYSIMIGKEDVSGFFFEVNSSKTYFKRMIEIVIGEDGEEEIETEEENVNDLLLKIELLVDNIDDIDTEYSFKGEKKRYAKRDQIYNEALIQQQIYNISSVTTYQMTPSVFDVSFFDSVDTCNILFRLLQNKLSENEQRRNALGFLYHQTNKNNKVKGVSMISMECPRYFITFKAYYEFVLDSSSQTEEGKNRIHEIFAYIYSLVLSIYIITGISSNDFSVYDCIINHEMHHDAPLKNNIYIVDFKGFVPQEDLSMTNINQRYLRFFESDSSIKYDLVIDFFNTISERRRMDGMFALNNMALNNMHNPLFQEYFEGFIKDMLLRINPETIENLKIEDNNKLIIDSYSTDVNILRFTEEEEEEIRREEERLEQERVRERQERLVIAQQVAPMLNINLAPPSGGRRRTMKSRRRKLSKKRKSKTKTKRKRN